MSLRQVYILDPVLHYLDMDLVVHIVVAILICKMYGGRTPVTILSFPLVPFTCKYNNYK